ncbi:MAG: hypothetical protein CMJ18_11155 [Phycisphaeraceae bacterium]|nr:hypothetical protein [Phycisphaeraceae bacterium]
MTRLQLACTCLLASAAILLGLLLTRLDANRAHAAEVVSEDPFTFLTARTRNDGESLFVIDNLNERLLIIHADVNREKIEVVGMQDLAAIFGRGRGGR